MNCLKCGIPTNTQHPCPFDEEVHNKITICSCCPDCKEECLRDT